MPKRTWIAILIFTAVIINYVDRIALSIASKPIAAEFGFKIGRASCRERVL